MIVVYTVSNVLIGSKFSRKFVSKASKRLFMSLAMSSTVGLGAAHAATLDFDVFLIANQSAPTEASVPQFTVSTTSVYKLGLNADNWATSATKIDNFDFIVKESLSHSNNSSGINSGESLAPGESAGDRINSETGTWDDVGIVSEGAPDAPKNTDFGNDSWVVFNGLDEGLTDLIIAEDAGLDPFKLYTCPATGKCEIAFMGLSRSLVNELGALDEFSLKDTSDPENMDQAFLFRFSKPVFDRFAIQETYNPDHYSSYLEVDFVGAGHAAVVPVPAGLPLLATGLGIFAFVTRRTKKAS